MPSDNPDIILGAFYNYEYTPPANLVTTIWGANSCGDEWVYGCNLGIATGPDSPIFTNLNGWNFKNVGSGNKNVGSGIRTSLARGRVPVGRNGGAVRVSAGGGDAQGIADLRHVSVTVEQLLYEKGGASELALRRGPRKAPGVVSLGQPLKASLKQKRHAVFRSLAGQEPKVKVDLRRRNGGLVAAVTAGQVTALEPGLCAGQPRTTDLWTVVKVDDGVNPPQRLETRHAWHCVKDKRGKRTLQALAQK